MSELPESQRAAILRFGADDLDGLLAGSPNEIVLAKLAVARARLDGPTLHSRDDDPQADAELDQLHAEALEMLRSAIRGERHFMVALVREDGETWFAAGGSPSSISPFDFLLSVETCAREMRERMEAEYEESEGHEV